MKLHHLWLAFIIALGIWILHHDLQAIHHQLLFMGAK